MIKNKLVESDYVGSLIYDRPFKSFANLYKNDLTNFIIENYCDELDISDNYEVISNELRTINYKDKQMVSDLIFKINDNITLNTS